MPDQSILTIHTFLPNLLLTGFTKVERARMPAGDPWTSVSVDLVYLQRCQI